MKFTTGLVVAAAVVGSSAQSLTGLSASCQAAGAAVLTGPASECLGIAGLVNVAMTSSNASLVTPVDNWLKTTCAQPACTNATIDAAIANITNGCSSDLTAAGVDTTSWQYITGYVKEWYPVGREIACLKTGDELCVTSTLKSIEAWVGQPLSKNTISTVIPKMLSTGSDIPSSLTCTGCIHAALSLILPHLSQTEKDQWTSTANQQCGSGFADGTTPSGITQSANTAVQGSSSNGALSSFGAWSTTALLAGAASFAALAL